MTHTANFLPTPAPPLSAENPLLAHNDPPEGSRIPKIVEFLARARDRLDSLDFQIAALTKERDAIAADMRSHTAVISVVRQLPTEILCRILAMAMKPLAYMELPQTPWALAQICRRWREVAVALPSLWSWFGVRTSPYNLNGLQDRRNPDESPQALESFQEQLRRAGRAPLHVTIEGDFKILPKTLDILRDVCERWGTLSIRKTSDYLDEIQECLPMLRAIYMDRVALEFSGPSAGVYRCARNLPGTPPNSLSQQYNWRDLIRYDGWLQPQGFLDLVRHATRLVECRTTVVDLRAERAPPLVSDICLLPCLNRLCVSGTECLQHIEAPGLQELAIDGNESGNPVEEKEIIKFLGRSSCQLLRLSIFDCGAALTSALLKAVPTLTELTIECTNKDVRTSLVNDLIPGVKGTNDPVVLPNLTAISLGERYNFADALKMVSLRFHKRDEYQQLRFFGMFVDASRARHSTKFLRTAALEPLVAMQAAGLQLCFVRTKPKYDRMRATDPYSVRRCAEHSELWTNQIWECTCLTYLQPVV
ncbi:hypothetical protein K438DRAFT_1995223 [Mycena galopus ATCC 62051]|nr:hypothetical protein K438DRAFT_1995223 [Mycena galopus ATCC 62051]